MKNTAVRKQSREAQMNPEVLEDLKSMDTPGEMPFIAQLVQMFEEHTPSCLSNIQAAIKNGNSSELSLHAHLLKSSCASLGALKMEEICSALETAGKNNRLAGTELLLEDLREEFGLVSTYLRSAK